MHGASMPLFFFNLRRQERHEIDHEGIAFDTLEDAREDAVNSLREIVADELRAGRSVDLTAIEIADNRGEIVAVVTIEEAVLKPLSEGAA
ncbi:hypothetical protein ASG68_24255 [Rhizobium sp. Leaf453]|nr:hypothetical protein ASG50_28620 [Rhizobium sp. Leaf386]KQU05887.1 hypothetical protein ASG68_24255 [Rhizobium sp. Leaf453]